MDLGKTTLTENIFDVVVVIQKLHVKVLPIYSGIIYCGNVVINCIVYDSLIVFLEINGAPEFGIVSLVIRND